MFVRKMGLEFFQNLTNPVRKEVLTQFPERDPLVHYFVFAFVVVFPGITSVFNSLLQTEISSSDY